MKETVRGVEGLTGLAYLSVTVEFFSILEGLRLHINSMIPLALEITEHPSGSPVAPKYVYCTGSCI